MQHHPFVARERDEKESDETQTGSRKLGFWVLWVCYQSKGVIRRRDPQGHVLENLTTEQMNLLVNT